MGKEGHPSFLTRAVLALEKHTVESEPQPKKVDSGRREFLKKVIIPIGIYLGGPAILCAITKELLSDQQEEERYKIRSSPKFEEEFKLGPNGEKLYFWGPRMVYWITTRGGVININNLTRSLFLASNREAFEKFLREEKVVLENVGSLNFTVLDAPGKLSKISISRTIPLSVNEDKELAGSEGEAFLREKSLDVSAEIGTNLLIAQEKGLPYLFSNASKSFEEEEKKRIREKFDPQKVPPFSIWRQPLK